MHKLRTISLFCVYLAILGLVNYELAAKSPQVLGFSLPGWQETRRAEHGTRMTHRIGWKPVDRLLHETEESLRYYRLLLNSPVRPVSLQLEIPQDG
ncbi:MAG: hypothetical protein ABIF77_05045 [bacterium]